MRFALFFVAFLVSVASGTMAIGLTAQDCLNIKDVYGWAPDGCELRKTDIAVSVEAALQKSQTLQTTQPTDQQIENHIFFPAGGTNLDSTARQQIEVLSQLFNGEVLGGACLALVGHSDTSGGEIANMQVAQARADAVGNEIRQRLSKPQKLERVLAVGESLPLANLSPRSKWQRRVEIRARDCPVAM